MYKLGFNFFNWVGLYSLFVCPNNNYSRTAWGPFFERKTRKMRPHGGRLERAFKAKTIGI
jgi:hypothetical protein